MLSFVTAVPVDQYKLWIAQQRRNLLTSQQLLAKARQAAAKVSGAAAGTSTD
jgi:hypothetical protein